MNILVSALYISNDKNYSKGGSMKYFSHLVAGLKNLGHTITALPKNELYKVRNFKFDHIITSHQETLREIAKNNIQSDKHSHVLQGIISQEQYYKGATDYISVSEEVRQFNLKTFNIDSRVINQPYIFEPVELKVNKTLPIKILHIKGNSSKLNIVQSNKLYSVVESDQSRDIMEMIKEYDVILGVGRSALDSIACGIPCIVADHRTYLPCSYGDGLLTKELLPESVKFNFNGKRFKHVVDKKFLDSQVIKYIQEFHESDMKELYDECVARFDCTKIASEVLNENG